MSFLYLTGARFNTFSRGTVSISPSAASVSDAANLYDGDPGCPLLFSATGAGDAKVDCNALTNPGFETSTLSGWTSNDGGFSPGTSSQTTTAGEFRSGSKALKLTGPSPGGQAARYQTITVRPGEYRKATFYIKGDATAVVYLKLTNTTTGKVYNGSACVSEESGDCPPDDPNYPNCDGSGRSAEVGTCGPGGAPACSGDEIDCSIVRQTWATRCALLGTEDPDALDLDSDPLAEYGGADAMFTDDGEIGPGSLDAGGWLSGGSCPSIAPIQVLGTSVSIPSVWCELSWLGSLLVSIAYLIALRIVYGE